MRGTCVTAKLACATAVIFAVMGVVSCYAKTPTAADDQVDAVAALIQRVLATSSGFVPEFVLGVDEGSSDFYFSLWSNQNGTIVTIEGNSGVALASGFHWWLKYSALCSISWLGDQLVLPSEPSYIPFYSVTSPYTFGYYMNVCTLGYSTSWWSWTRWEREIDWMAMNGVNFPLAFVGQEKVWQDVYTQLGIPAEDINEFFGGPAFLPWQRMGNVDGWAGPLPQYWIDSQYNLQLQILERMRSFGMTVVLPGFAGHVPSVLTKYYPDASVTELGSWNAFNGTFFLDPLDPLFVQIGSLFVSTISTTYGTDHFYNCDPFNEMDPPSNDTDYLSSVSQTIYSSMSVSDPKAVWVLQGWFLVNSPDFWLPAQAEAFLTAVNIEDLIVLDLYGEVKPVWEENLFYGRQFIWNMLHNYGGRPGLYGTLPRVANGPVNALNNASAFIVGVGYTPEGIETNPIAYDLTSEMIWRNKAPDLDDWVGQYSVRRYGVDNKNARTAWSLLQNSVYNCTTSQHGATGSLVGARPDINITKVGHSTSSIYWDPADVCNAWDLLLGESDVLQNVTTYQYDLTDLTAQVLSDVMLDYHSDLINAFNAGDSTSFETAASQITKLITDMDQLVSTRPMYLVGKWISDAMSWATDDSTSLLYQYNARLQITMWGLPESDLNDYAYKLWGGLVSGYFLPRWETFIDSLRLSIGNSTAWDHDEYTNQVIAVEQQWSLETDFENYPSTPSGDTVQVATEIYNSYYSQCPSKVSQLLHQQYLESIKMNKK
ncbi:lysosomal alpha-N-acetyl glucosaminidase [Pelomyxa schiedti]|nr:lysosomal alpha-N-acetyl glucosaminidase [Pelomyxa schiedti]